MWNPTARLLINRFLSYLILSYLILSYLIFILSYLILSYPKAFLVDWGNQCLKQVVVEFACVYDCWKMCVLMEAICSAVSIRTLAGSSSGPVALFSLRCFKCLIIPFVPISRGGMLEYNQGSIAGMGYLSLVNTDVNWLLRTFALSRSFVIGLSFTLRAGMPKLSRLFALMNDHNRFCFVFRLSPIWLFT